MSTIYPRISGRRGQIVDLQVAFYRGGALADPYAIRLVEIYKTQVLPHNLVASLPIVDVDDVLYPAPVARVITAAAVGDCGTEPETDPVAVIGKYHLEYAIPKDFTVPDVYYDVWYYFADNPCGELGSEEGTGCDIDDPQYDDFRLSCCHRFWVYPEEWFCNDGLQTVRFGFEPLDQRFNAPEVRPLELSLMPLPLYDHNHNLVGPLIPFLQPSITIETMQHELLVQNAAMSMGLRQGSYRTNPFVVRYMLDTSKFLKGTYRYRVTLALPDGTTRTSQPFVFTVS